MKEVIAIIRPEAWKATMDAVAEAGLDHVFQFRVMGRGKQRGLRYLRPHSGPELGTMPFLPKRMASWMVEDASVDALVEAVIGANKTANYGDGRLFVCPIDVSDVLDTTEDEIAEAPADLASSPVATPVGGKD
jgi:nitrogen regulatory protein PII 2